MQYASAQSWQAGVSGSSNTPLVSPRSSRRRTGSTRSNARQAAVSRTRQCACAPRSARRLHASKSCDRHESVAHASVRGKRKHREIDGLENGTYRTRPRRQASQLKITCKGTQCKLQINKSLLAYQQQQWFDPRSAPFVTPPSTRNSRMKKNSARPGLEPGPRG
jgi:hypothetical protein